MKVVTFLNEKGGVGKTTACVTVGAGLAQRGKRVLLIDADAQGHVATSLGMQPRPAFYDWLVRNAEYRYVVEDVPMDRWIFPGEHPLEPTNCLHLLASNHETRNVASAINDTFAVLRRLLEIRDQYDYVLIDTSPTPSLLHPLIYAATSHYVFVTLAETLSLRGLAATIERVKDFDPFRKEHKLPKARLLGIQPCRVRKGVLEHGDNLIAVKERYPRGLLPAIHERIVWSEASRNGKAIFAYAPESDAALEALSVVDAVEVGYVAAAS